MILSSITEIDQLQWTELVAVSPTATFFQTPECYHFYTSLSFLHPFVYGVSEKDKLVGIFCGYVVADGNYLKRYFSKRAIVPGGVLLDSQISSEALESLLYTATSELSRKAIYLEVRNYNDFTHFRTGFEASGFFYQQHLNFHVETTFVEKAMKQLSSTKRRDLKLSKMGGAQWFETNDVEDIRIYYTLLKHLYETKIKTPLFPFEFFEKLVKEPFGKLFVVKYHNEIIGGSVCVVLPNKTIYEWFVCGLDGQIKNVFPSTLATWAAIEYAASNDFGRFDMMGAGKPEESYGVRNFKSKFGGELVEHGRFLFICKPFLYTLGKYIVEKMKTKK